MNASRAASVIRNAVVWSDGAVVPGAVAVAFGEDGILAVGSERDVLAAAPHAEVIDAGGATVTPGMTDAHIHLLAWARSLDELALAGAGGVEDVARRLGAYAAERAGDAVLVGRGWDENHWERKPHRSVLDAVAAARPVLLHSHDFHALWLNGAALRQAGIHAGTADPAGGVIERDERGEPTGVLREHAVRLAARLFPAPDDRRDRAALRRAAAALHALGITGVHAFEGGRARRLLRELARDESSGLRVLMHLPHDALEAAAELGVASGTGDPGFRIGAIKLFADGTLGSRTAALLAPYAGTDSAGMDLIEPAELRRLVARAAGAGLATAIHAIGDRAVRSTLDAFEAASTARAALALPCRIEHVQLASPADLPRFAALGVAASLQPTHAISDMETAERWWPDRLEHAYPWKALADRGALLAFGSDAPVEPPGAARTLHAAVTRQRVDGTPAGGWDARQRLTLDQALSASTEGPARLAGNWPRVGRIATGAEADLVVWDRNLHAEPLASLHEARPRLTIFGGRIVHGGAGAGSAARGAKSDPAPRAAATTLRGAEV
jgi:predicted amidohydrolase YtcJ